MTDSSIYLDTILKDGENAALYSLNSLESLPEIIKGLLDSPERMQRIADAGYQMARNGHTWEYRAEEIMKILESID